MTSSPHGLYVQGYTRATMTDNKALRNREVEPIAQSRSQFGLSLQLDSMKLESLVIADQHAAVNTFPGLVHTARHITKVGCARSGWS